MGVFGIFQPVAGGMQLFAIEQASASGLIGPNTIWCEEICQAHFFSVIWNPHDMIKIFVFAQSALALNTQRRPQSGHDFIAGRTLFPHYGLKFRHGVQGHDKGIHAHRMILFALIFAKVVYVLMMGIGLALQSSPFTQDLCGIKSTVDDTIYHRLPQGGAVFMDDLEPVVDNAPVLHLPIDIFPMIFLVPIPFETGYFCVA